MLVVDAHCDTITVLANQNRDLGSRSSLGHLDIPRLQAGGVNTQFFAIFVGPEHYNKPVEYTYGMINYYFEEINKNKHRIQSAANWLELEKTLKDKKIGAVLTIEGGEALGGKIEQLYKYYQLGVRGLTLTWNGRNEIGDGVGMGKLATGLTAFGREVISCMSQLGMVIDISHLSESSFWDVMEETSIPVAASHSNCLTVCAHPRNLSDKQIEAIAQRGGVVGITFVPQFIDSQSPSIDRLIDHIDHLYNVGGINCIGVGSDFDGIDSIPTGLHDASVAVPNLEVKLSDRGYSTGEIEKILGLNWLQYFKEVCG